MNQLPDVYDARSSIVWLRLISSLAWLDSALVGKDAKLSYAFLSGLELAKRIGETFVLTAVTPALSALLRNVVLPLFQTRPRLAKLYREPVKRSSPGRLKRNAAKSGRSSGSTWSQ
jgi:hypothetical protein